MTRQLRVFVSHSHEDDAFCRTLVQALRQAGADVWYDEQTMAPGGLGPPIMRELLTRPVFVVILSPAALQSQRVEDESRRAYGLLHDESRWAYGLLHKDPRRILLLVVATPLPDEDAAWPFLQAFKRIAAPGLLPSAREEVVRRTLSVLALTSAGAAPTPAAPQPAESVDDLITRGKALQAQGKHAEALPLFERATQLAPGSFAAWAHLSYTLDELDRCEESLAACDRALALDDTQTWVWTTKGDALNGLGFCDEAWTAYERAVATCERALVLDPNDPLLWANKGAVLSDMGLWEEALVAYEQALMLDPTDATAWTNKGGALSDVGRYQEALAIYERALALDPNDPEAWVSQGITLHFLKRHEEALVAYDRALALDPTYARAWINKGLSLRHLGRTAEAKAAEQWAKELDG